MEKMKNIFEAQIRYAKELADEELTSVNAAGVPDVAYGATHISDGRFVEGADFPDVQAIWK